MAKLSAGILLWKQASATIEIYLAHPGGPFWANRDEGSWTIPKGVVEPCEDPLTAALREFQEETGASLLHDAARAVDLGEVTQKSGKVVRAWAIEGDAPSGVPPSNTVRVKWNGAWISVPEVDRCEWFDPESAMRKINPAQAELIVRLLRKLAE